MSSLRERLMFEFPHHMIARGWPDRLIMWWLARGPFRMFGSRGPTPAEREYMERARLEKMAQRLLKQARDAR